MAGLAAQRGERSGRLFITLLFCTQMVACLQPPTRESFAPPGGVQRAAPIGRGDVQVVEGRISWTVQNAWSSDAFEQALVEAVGNTGLFDEAHEDGRYALSVELAHVERVIAKTSTSTDVCTVWVLRDPQSAVVYQDFVTTSRVFEGGVFDVPNVDYIQVAAARDNLAEGVARVVRNATADSGDSLRLLLHMEPADEPTRHPAQRAAWERVLEAMVASNLGADPAALRVESARHASKLAPDYRLMLRLDHLQDVGLGDRAFVGFLAGRAEMGVAYRVIRERDGSEIAAGVIDQESILPVFVWEDSASAVTANVVRGAAMAVADAVKKGIEADAVPGP